MKKILSSILVISFVTSLLLLGFQWNQFKTLQAMSIQERVFMSNVKMVYEGKQLKIEQRLDVKKGEEWSEFRIPSEVSKFTCTDEAGKPCEMKIEGKSAFVKIESKPIFTFSYSLPLNSISAGGEIIDKPLFHFVKPSTGQVRLMVLDRVNLKGDWVFAGQKLGVSANKMVKVYTFEDQDLDGSFYVSKEPLEMIEDNADITFISNHKVKTFAGELKQLFEGLPFKEKFTLVINPNIKEKYYSTSLVVLPNIANREEFSSKYVLAFMGEKWVFEPRTKNQLVSLLANILLEKEPENQKFKMVLDDFYKKFTTEERKVWVNSVLENHTKEITAATLDDKVHELFDVETSYFQTNMKEHSYTPFYAVVQRDLYINRAKTPEKLLSYNNTTYIKVSLLSGLGIKIKPLDSNQVLAQYKDNVWKLSSNKNIFIFNGDYYEIPGLALVKFGNEFYISEYWANQIFNIKLIDMGDKIHMSI